MTYGRAISLKKINRDNHKLYDINGEEVSKCSTSKKWNDEVIILNENTAILKPTMLNDFDLDLLIDMCYDLDPIDENLEFIEKLKTMKRELE